jgi:hypothetical protein
MKCYYFQCVLLILSILFITSTNAQVKRITIKPSAVVSTNMDELSRLERTNFIYPESKGEVGPNIFPVQPIMKSSGMSRKDVVSNILGIPSPAPTANFLAQADVPTIPQNLSWIPPDTWGAVGPLNLMSVHNNNVKIQNRAGLQLSLVSLATFWSPLVPAQSTVFDPKIVYDQYNDRWIVVSLSDPSLMTSSLLVAISNSKDPTGGWTEYRYVMGANILGNNCWADYPCIGFNKNWVAISVNMFTIAAGAFQESRVLVISYPELLAIMMPSPTTSLFINIPDFTIQPCITYSATQEILYAPNSIWGVPAYRLNYIMGTPNAPIFTIGIGKGHTVLSPWVGYIGQVLPQIPEVPTGRIEYIDGDDDRINNAVFRGENIYYSQAVGLPFQSMTHTAAQWVVLDTAANYIDGGRIEDPMATNTNGKPWYAYPSINVNGYGDILVGFSQYSSMQAAASGYCLKDRTDPPGTMRDPWIYKPGVTFYYKTFGASRNRWGDFSFVQPDPLDNYKFWTIQEFANQQLGLGDGSGRWGTWWAQVQPFSLKTPLSLILTLYIEARTNPATGQMVPDTVSCIIRNGASPYSIVDSLKVLLDTFGQGVASFTQALINNNYYIVIKHRNSVETWSHLVNFPMFNPSYDFTLAQNQAYGNNQIMVGTKWCIYTGDVNQDGFVTGDDYTGVDNDASNFDYHLVNDLNGDGFVTGDDFTCIDNNGASFIQRQVPPGAPPAAQVSKPLSSK